MQKLHNCKNKKSTTISRAINTLFNSTAAYNNIALIKYNSLSF